MQEQVQLLKELQEIDQELNRMRQTRQKLEAEDAALAADLGRVQEMVDSLLEDLERLQTQRRELTQALHQEQENVKKAESRLPTIKTQKEYVAVLKEIDTAKKMNKEILDRTQEKDREIEALEREKEEKTASLSALREKVESRRAEMAAEQDEAGRQWEEKNAQKTALLARLPVTVRKRYQLLFERRGGIAIVEARNGACLGCNMHLPPQLFNSLFRAQELQSCPHCNRMLFVENPL